MCLLHCPGWEPPFSASGTPCQATLNPPCFQATEVISNMVADQGDTASFTCLRTVLRIKDTLRPLTPLPWVWNRHLLPDGLLKARSQVEVCALVVTALLGVVTGVASKVFNVHNLHWADQLQALFPSFSPFSSPQSSLGPAHCILLRETLPAHGPSPPPF